MTCSIQPPPSSNSVTLFHVCKMYTKNDMVFVILVNTDFWLTLYFPICLIQIPKSGKYDGAPATSIPPELHQCIFMTEVKIKSSNCWNMSPVLSLLLYVWCMLTQKRIK